MEAKGIFYLFLGLGYLIYSLTKKAKDQPKKTNAPQPKKRSTFDEAIEEFKSKQQQIKDVAVETQNKKPTKQKDIFVKEKINPVFEEGKSVYRVYEEASFAEGGSQIQFVDEMPIQEETPTNFNIDIRSGIINSIILERKF
jgi:hypothetical protein